MSLDLDARQRAALDSLLRERGLYDRARAVLASTAASSTTGGDVFEALRSAGLTEELAEAAKDVNLDLDAATFSLLRREPPVLPAEAPASPQAQAQSQPPSQAQLPPAARAAAPEAGRSLLRITLGRGRAFLAHLDEANVEGDGGAGGDGLPGPSPSSFYVVHLLCCGQRFRSAAVPAAVEPDFGGASFDIDVTPEADADDGRVRSSGSSAATLRLLLDLPAPAAAASALHVALTFVTQRRQPAAPTQAFAAAALLPEAASEVIGVRSLDWRAVGGREDGSLSLLVQLAPASPGPQNTGSGGQPVATGLLPLALQLLPAPGDAALAPAEAKQAIDRVAAATAAAERAFFSYSKSWWAEFKADHPAFRRRAVKIFAESETGEFAPTVSFVTPLAADRVVNSPAEAGRFVSLLPYREAEAAVAGGGAGSRREVWHSLHSMLAARSGGAEDHAALLCSLLLGLGMDAYVAVGSRTRIAGGSSGNGDDLGSEEEAATWVITRYSVPAIAVGDAGSSALASSPAASSPARPAAATAAAASASRGFRVNCWEPLSGHRGAPGDILPSGHCFARVACVFSADRFYACTAADDTAATVSWDLDDARAWKGMDPSLLRPLAHSLAAPLAPPSLGAGALAVALEASLRAAVEAHRAEPAVRKRLTHARAALGGPPVGAALDGADAAATAWDERLPAVLQQALAAYEAERVFGISIGGAEFASSVKRCVPRGSAFRGFPICFNHLSVARMVDALVASSVARDIIETPAHEGGGTAFALRVAVTLYAEDVTAVWVFVAVRTQVVQ